MYGQRKYRVVQTADKALTVRCPLCEWSPVLFISRSPNTLPVRMGYCSVLVPAQFFPVNHWVFPDRLVMFLILLILCSSAGHVVLNISTLTFRGSQPPGGIQTIKSNALLCAPRASCFVRARCLKCALAGQSPGGQTGGSFARVFLFTAYRWWNRVRFADWFHLAFFSCDRCVDSSGQT